MYRPHYERASNTHLIDDVMYSKILEVCLRAPGSKFDNCESGYCRKYQVQGNIQRRVLYRGDLAVTTYEQVFDVILEAHNKLSHASDVRKNKKCINEDLGYYGVPEQAVQCFIDTCPTVSVVLFHIFCEKHSATVRTNLNSKLPQCLSNIVLTKAKQQPLRMIMSQRVGSRFQMDLIEMPPFQGWRHILRVVDHLSLYGFVAPLK